MPMAGHSSHGQLINLNTAILSALDKLEAKLGIPALSNRIQASRPYASIDELVSKHVLTQAQFDQIKDMVTVEDIELTGEAKDIDYFVKLGLMKGHLLVAKELLDLGKPQQAEPHIGHPVEEIYVDVEEQLQERGVPEFKTTLVHLQDLVKSKPNDPQVAVQYQAAMKAVDQAIAALPIAQRQSPVLVLQVINGLLDTASSEYTAAISNHKITEAIEYQDSRGFVTYAQMLLTEIAAPLQKASPQTQAKLQAQLTALAKTWPAPLPPATPVQTPEAVTSQIKALEQVSQTVTAAKPAS